MLWSAITRWLLVLQLGNYPKAWEFMLVLQRKRSLYASITREAEVWQLFFPTVTLGLYTLQSNIVSCLAGLLARYSC